MSLLEACVQVKQVGTVELARDASQIGGSFFEIFRQFVIIHDDSARNTHASVLLIKSSNINSK
jgi:hypothetical protein